MDVKKQGQRLQELAATPRTNDEKGTGSVAPHIVLDRIQRSDEPEEVRRFARKLQLAKMSRQGRGAVL